MFARIDFVFGLRFPSVFLHVFLCFSLASCTTLDFETPVLGAQKKKKEREREMFVINALISDLSIGHLSGPISSFHLIFSGSKFIG